MENKIHVPNHQPVMDWFKGNSVHQPLDMFFFGWSHPLDPPHIISVVIGGTYHLFQSFSGLFLRVNFQGRGTPPVRTGYISGIDSQWIST